VFRNLLDAAKGALIRAAASTQTLGNSLKGTMRIFCLVALAFVMGLSANDTSLDSYTVVKLHYGLNRVDFNNDGEEDLVVIARRENFNAHGFDVVTFYSNQPRNQQGNLAIVPMFDKEKEDLTLEVSGGADCLLHDFRLLKPKHGNEALLIVASRVWSKSFAENNVVAFSYYKLETNHSGLPGRPVLYFTLSDVRQAKKKYCDVNEAFHSELGLENYIQRDY